MELLELFFTEIVVPIGLVALFVAVPLWLLQRWQTLSRRMREASSREVRQRAIHRALKHPVNDTELLDMLEENWRVDNQTILGRFDDEWRRLKAIDSEKLTLAGHLWRLSQGDLSNLLLRFLRERCKSFAEARSFTLWAEVHFRTTDYFNTSSRKHGIYKQPEPWGPS